MNKTVVRKGLFETASSSEDSVSVYQDMKLFIMPLEEYENFKNGEAYAKLNNMTPQYTDDEDVVIADTTKQMEKLKITLEAYKNYINPTEEHPFIYVPRWAGDFPYYLNNFYTSYEAYKQTATRYYYEVRFFEYENNGDMIFGFYGYFEN